MTFTVFAFSFTTTELNTYDIKKDPPNPFSFTDPGMLRGRGGSWFLGCSVSSFVGLLTSWFRSFVVSKFLGFLFSKFQSFKVSLIAGYQTNISWFLEYIDPTSKMFKNSLDGSSGFVGTRLFHSFQTLGFPKR